MLSLKYYEWVGELETLIEDIYGITLYEFLEGKYSAMYYYRQGFNPIEALESIEEEKNDTTTNEA